MANVDRLLTALRKQGLQEKVTTKKRSKLTPKKNTRLPFMSYYTRGESSHRNNLLRVTQKTLIDREKVMTREEKMVLKKLEAAYDAAVAANKECIQVIMRPSYVGYRCFMTIKAKWLNKHIPPDVEVIILRMGDRTWETKLHRRNASGGLNTGWNHFVEEHSLEYLDACLFTLGEYVGGRVFLDVQIFPIADQIVPPKKRRLDPNFRTLH